MASDAVKLNVDGDSDDDEVYRRPLSSNKIEITGGMPDPAVRYSSGARSDKSISRYSSTLKTMIPIRTSRTLRGGAKVDEAGIFSFVTYAWVFEYLWQAFRKRLDSSQEWSCSIYDASNVNIARLEIVWEEEKAKAAVQRRNPSLLRAMFMFLRTRVFTACAVFLFCLIFGFIGPTCFVRKIIAFAELPIYSDQGIDYGFGLLLVFSLFFVEIARVLSYGATWAISYRTGIRVRGAVLGLLFKRAIGMKTLARRTPAEIVNMFANDGQRLFDAVTFAPLVVVGPLVLLVGVVYLIIVIGVWSLLGIAVFFVFDAIQYCLGKTMVRCRERAIQKTERRLSFMGEMIRCIRVIKMNAWENTFIDKAEAMRHEEKVELRKSGYAQSLAISCGPIVPVVAAILTFLGVVLSGNDLLASDAFSAITVFFVMLFGVRMIPYGSRYLAESIVALRRIQLLLEEEQWEGPAPQPTDPKIAVNVKNAAFSWSAEEKAAEGAEATTEETPALEEKQQAFAINDINLKIEKKQLIGICGPVGAGKSALCSAIAGHMFPLRGEVEVAGKLALVPQVPWIQNATIQENILFGQPMNTKKYYKVISAAQLTKDLEAMSANDQTEVGERGTTLSGGQKARVALARALYSPSDVFLLDDVLAACDAKVSKKIFDEAVLDMLRGKTVILVTNDVERLSRCDLVYLMEKGAIVSSGKHEDLIKASDAYKSYCHEVAQRAADDSVDTVLVGKTKDESVVDRVTSPSEEGYEHLDETNPVVETETVQLVGVKEKSTNDGKLVDDEEDLGTAKISWRVYKKYICAAGGLPIWLLLLFAFFLNVFASIFSTFWLSQWMKKGHNETVVTQAGEDVLVSYGSLAESEDTPYYAQVYGISLVVLFLSGFFKAFVFVKVSLNAASRLHGRMLKSVVGGSASFFDQTPSGRLINRFSKDMDEIDVKMPFTFEVFLQNMLTCIGFIIVIAWVFPVFLLASIPLFAIFLLFVLCFRAGIRSMKRSENNSRSPLFSHVTTSLEGLQVIHSHEQTERFMNLLKQRLDANSGAMFMFQSAMRWLAVWLDLLVVLVTTLVALFIVLLTGSISPAEAGMALSFAIQMSGIFQFAVRNQTELEAKMTSVERVAYYTENVEQDGDWETRKGTDIPNEWPTKGQVDFMNVNLRYHKSSPLALSDVTLTIEGGEKVAIIGRTGSGKSSLGNALFRMYRLSNGSIYIDGVDISTVGLHRLRKAMAVIPQDPVLFAGTIRYNLDPCQQYPDHQLWTALEKAHLHSLVSNLSQGLDSEVTAGGDNFSVGERQLLCMARALLVKAKVVLLDEATANLDAATDRLIWNCIQSSFEGATVMVIAHRLNHVHQMSRIIMLDAGKLVDFDDPSNILKKSSPTSSVEEDKTSAEIVEKPEDAEESEAEIVSEAVVESIADTEEEKSE